jgi:hypothetical protein
MALRIGRMCRNYQFQFVVRTADHFTGVDFLKVPGLQLLDVQKEAPVRLAG